MDIHFAKIVSFYTFNRDLSWFLKYFSHLIVVLVTRVLQIADEIAAEYKSDFF